ncbi:hypothetical protein [Pedobacter jeongneungensis]|uniref:hypothetical protein n=1 Tax=Pedobacter jeongneungensis TaxID=947309 RepID=UPI000468EFAB|nr:hypothetical protein [Pedobacter jeongneungensis]
MTNREKFIAGQSFFLNQLPENVFCFADDLMYNLNTSGQKVFHAKITKITPHSFTVHSLVFGSPTEVKVPFKMITFGTMTNREIFFARIPFKVSKKGEYYRFENCPVMAGKIVLNNGEHHCTIYRIGEESVEVSMGWVGGLSTAYLSFNDLIFL